jgi:hypothetical protein
MKRVMTEQQIFTANIQTDGINPYVDVTAYLIVALGVEPKAMVLVKVAGITPEK